MTAFRGRYKTPPDSKLRLVTTMTLPLSSIEADVLYFAAKSATDIRSTKIWKRVLQKLSDTIVAGEVNEV